MEFLVILLVLTAFVIAVLGIAYAIVEDTDRIRNQGTADRRSIADAYIEQSEARRAQQGNDDD
jgi:hypothetical protein